MNKLFIHNPWFRLLCPIFSGTLVYLLILLINDSVLSIKEEFLGQELYVCIGLAYVAQEFSRISLLVFERIPKPSSFVVTVLMQLLLSVLVTILVVSISIYFYFKYVLLYTPNSRELYIFNSIFSFITLLYVVLYLGHYFLNRKNTKKLQSEEQAKMAIEADLNSYKRGINPDLLFASLEAMLVTMKKDPEKAEQLADHFATVYRYILSKKSRELVTLKEELEIVGELVHLFDHLPFRKVKIGKATHKNPLIIPTSVLSLVEAVVKTSIPSEKNPIGIEINEETESINIVYESEERLNQELSMDTLAELNKSYQFYSTESITITPKDDLKIIQLPKLIYHEGSHT